MKLVTKIFIFFLTIFFIILGNKKSIAQWVQTNGPGGGIVFAFAVRDTNLFAGTYGGGVFMSANNGTSWTEVNYGLGNTQVSSLTVSDTNLFAGTYSSNVWRSPLSEMITSVEGSSIGLPIGFAISQNYPNPFNPSTMISYSIPRNSFVHLKVFDILGNDVAELVNEQKPAGSYEVKFDAASLPSGVYFYQLTAGEFIQTKKMILLK